MADFLSQKSPKSLQIYNQFIFEILISTNFSRVSLLFFHIYAPLEYLMVNDGTSRMHNLNELQK